MKLSEAPMMQPLLCKSANSNWSEVFEVMKLGLSASGRAVYVRALFGTPGQQPVCQHYWREVADLDSKWEVLDTLAA